MANKRQTDQVQEALTQEQKAIRERVSAQDTSWFTISEHDMNDFSLMVNPMDLHPNYPVAAKLQEEKKYAFRWAERTPRRIDELTRSVSPPMRWAVVNRDTLPEMAEQVDDVLGCVCCLDQLLLFKPYSHAMIVKEQKQRMADAKYRAPKDKMTGDGIESAIGEQYKVQRDDVVEYEDTRGSETEGLEDLVVDE